MTTAGLKVELPGDDIAFLKTYAAEHRMTLPNLLARYVTALRAAPRRAPHPANLQFTGTVSTDLHAREAHRQHLTERHR